MRSANRLSILIYWIILIIVAGCSGPESAITPVMPDKPDQQQNLDIPEEYLILFSGSFEIDLDRGSIDLHENRDPQYNLNITGLLNTACPGGCFRFRILSINGTELTIELKITNPSSIQVYDVRLIYLNLYGKSVLNPDSYTDLFTAGNISPFTAFAKENTYRDFPVGPGGVDTEELILDYPAGAPPLVDFIIVASLPENTQEPFEIVDMYVDGTFTTDGGTAELSMYVHDHQDDVSQVVADTTLFTGGLTYFVADDPLNQYMYHATINDTSGVPAGTYDVWIVAESLNDYNAKTYNYFTIDVLEMPCKSEAHEYVGTYLISGVDFFIGEYWYSRDIAFIEVGPNAGKIIYPYDMCKYGLIDPVASDQVMDEFFIVDDESGCGPVEVCPMTGRIFLSGSVVAGIFAPDGRKLGVWSDVEGDARIKATEIDDNGDLWAVVHVDSPESGHEFRLRHYLYSADDPWYELPAAHDSDIRSLDEPYPEGLGFCPDLALDFERDIMYIFMNESRGDYLITAYDVSTGYAIELYSRNDVFSKKLHRPGWQGDIEIDHSVKEKCSIVVGSITKYDYEIHYELVRLDGELNILDFDDSFPYASEFEFLPYTFTIAQTGSHPIIGIGKMDSPITQNKMHYFESPDW